MITSQREQQTKKQRIKSDWAELVELMERQGEYTHRAILFDPRDAKRGRSISRHSLRQKT